MDALECIFTRRSIRSYDLDRPITEEIINILLAAGCSAPSAHNGRPWQFVVIQDKERIRALSEVKVYYEKPLKHAPLAIGVVIDPTVCIKSKLGYKYQDCAAATQNILLAARALGLGSCWMGGYLEPEEIEKVSKLLKIPETMIFFGLISIGYPTEIKAARGVVEDEKVHYETFEAE